MNTQIQDIKKMLRVITIILIGATLLTPFIFSGDFFFPFITAKAFFMRAMILLASISYIGLALIDKNSRPKKSVMLYALLGFMAVLVLATLNSVNPTRSLWSNFERMEGLVTMLYMAALFIMSASTLRKNEWSWLLNTSIAISIIVGANALSEPGRIAGHLGNSSYLGVYALIHIFFGMLAALMIFRGNREKELLESGQHVPAKAHTVTSLAYMSIYILISIFNVFILYRTGTRGAFVGLVIGLVFASVFLAWKEKNKIIRFSAMGFLTAVLLSVSLLGFFKHSALIQNSNGLSRFAALVTTDYKSVLNNEGQARTMIWKMAFEGVKERPLLGWGQDNFGYVFARYYNPHMFNQEQWFDRSHDVFMDWLIAAGILGLVGYLSLFAVALYFIFSKKARFTIIEKSLWLGLLAAYFVHNIFVFDNLASYVLFFLILAYINDRYTHDRNEPRESKPLSEHDTNSIILVSFIGVIVLSSLGYYTLLKPYTQNQELLGVLRDVQAGIPKDIDTRFKNTYEMSDNGKLETFEQMSSLLSKVAAAPNVSTTTKQNMFIFYQGVVAQYDKDTYQDARFNFFTSNAYRSMGMNEKALAYARKAYTLSPQKQSFAYAYALLLFENNAPEEASAVVKKAYTDAPENVTAYGYYIGIQGEILKKTNYNLDQLNALAVFTAAGYVDHGHTLIFGKEVYSLISNPIAKKIFVNKLIELLPAEKYKILEAAK